MLDSHVLYYTRTTTHTNTRQSAATKDNSCTTTDNKPPPTEEPPSDITASQMTNINICIHREMQELFETNKELLSFDPKTEGLLPGGAGAWLSLEDQKGEDEGFVALPKRPDNGFPVGEWSILNSLLHSDMYTKGFVKNKSTTGQKLFNRRGKGKKLALTVLRLHYWLHPPLHVYDNNLWQPCHLTAANDKILKKSIPTVSLRQPIYVNIGFQQTMLLNLLVRRQGNRFAYSCPSGRNSSNSWFIVDKECSAL